MLSALPLSYSVILFAALATSCGRNEYYATQLFDDLAVHSAPTREWTRSFAMDDRVKHRQYVAGQPSASGAIHSLRESERLLELLSSDPDHDSTKRGLLDILKHLQEYHDETGDTEDAKILLEIGRRILDRLVSGDEPRKQFLVHAMQKLWDNYELETQGSDVSQTSKAADQGHTMPRTSHGTLVTLPFLDYFGFILEAELRLDQNFDNLSELIAATEEALAGSSIKGLVRPDLELELAGRLELLGGFEGTTQPVDRALDICRHVISMSQPGDRCRIEALFRLQDLLTIRQETGFLADPISESARGFESISSHPFDEAISLVTTDIPSIPVLHPRRIVIIYNLYLMHFVRHTELDDERDLDEAIRWIREAIASPLVIGQQREDYLEALAVALGVRCVLQTRPADIQEAISLGRSFLDRTDAKDRHRRATWLAYLGTRFSEAHGNEEKLDDLNQAITLLIDALETGVPREPDLPTLEQDLGALLLERYEEAQELKDLEEAIKRTRHALDSMGQGHPIRPLALRNLANQLGALAKGTSDDDVLDEAILKGREAVAVEDPQQEDMAEHLNTLARLLAMRYERTGKEEDIVESVECSTDAVDLEGSE